MGEARLGNRQEDPLLREVAYHHWEGKVVWHQVVPSYLGVGRVLEGKADEAEMLREDHRSPWEGLETVVGVRLGGGGQTRTLLEEGRLRSHTLQ